MTYAVNTSVAPTEGFTGNNMGYTREAITSTHFSTPYDLERLPSGAYLLSVCDLHLTNLNNTPDWYELIDLSTVSGVTSSTFKAVNFQTMARNPSTNALTVFNCRYNFSNSVKVEVYTTDIDVILGYYLSFQLVLIPQ